MRLFVAIDLDQRTRDAIDHEQQRVAARMGPEASRARFVDRAHLHLTLVFARQVEPHLAPAVADTVGTDVPVPPFDVTLGGLGVFPARGAPRVLWLGLIEGARETVALQAVVRSRIASLGIAVEDRAFHPHLTIARWRESRSPGGRQVLHGSAETVARVRVEGVSLYRKPALTLGPVLYSIGLGSVDVPMSLFLIGLAAYLIGSVPFALILSRFGGAIDPRIVGSRNPGAANVLRTAGVRAGVAVAVLDALKGAAGVLVATPLGGPGAAPAVAGMATILGHVYPIWFRFRGGKGVATACGVFLVLAPLALLPTLALFVAGVWLTNYISIGSLLASAALPPLAYAAGSPASEVAAALAASALIAFRHRANLLRVIAGTEPGLAARTPAATESREP